MPLSSADFREFYSLHNDRYRRAFGVSNEQSILGFLYCDAIVEYLGVDRTSTETLRILDVGCGEGLATRELVETLFDRLPQVTLSVTGVDPCETSLKRYRRFLSEKPNIEANNPRIVVSTLEDYVAQVKPESFDVLLCDHSLYCVELSVFQTLLDKMVSPRTLALVALASRDAPVSRLRQSQGRMTALHSEGLRSWLIENGHHYLGSRYHARFNVPDNRAIPVASWLQMMDIEDKGQALQALRLISCESNTRNVQFENIADVLAVFPRMIDGTGSLVSLGGDLLAHEADRMPQSYTHSFVTDVSGRFQSVLRGAVGFCECGVLFVDDQFASKPTLTNAKTHPYIFSCTTRVTRDVDRDTQEELRGRLLFIHELGLFEDFTRDVSLAKLKTAGAPDLENHRQTLIQNSLAASGRAELLDELANPDRRNDVEKELGVLWITGGEHTLCSLLAVLRSGSFRSSWRKVAKAMAFSCEPVKKHENDFMPTKRFLRFVEWLRELFVSVSKELPDAMAAFQKKMKAVGVPECVARIRNMSLRIEGKAFRELCGLIWNAKIDPRAVPEICYFVSAGMKWECPNLLIFPAPRLLAGESYGFVTTIDLDECVGVNCLRNSIHQNTRRLAKQRISALTQIFRQLFIRTELSPKRSDTPVWGSPALMDKFYSLCETAQYGAGFAAAARRVIIDSLMEVMSQIPLGTDTTPLGEKEIRASEVFENVLASMWEILVGDYAEIKQRKCAGDSGQYPDVQLHMHEIGEAGASHGVLERLRKSLGSRVPIDAKNYSKITLGDVRQMAGYLEALDNKALVGVIFCRGKPHLSKAVQSLIRDKRSLHKLEIVVHGSEMLKKLLDSYANGNMAELLDSLGSQPFRRA